ncbi:hypothetical protein K2Q16_03005 [Patescibacteria group bacterium]|nr:hypothetical protein [Patescibacteria group bacterium]
MKLSAVFSLWTFVFFSWALPWVLLAQVSGSLPVATTVMVAGDAVPGSVVRYDVTTNTYSLTAGSDDGLVYGVIAELPAIVVVTEDGAVPVVAEGGVMVRVTGEVPVVRGDVLTSSAIRGIATRATNDSAHPFAVVQEVYDTPTNDGVYEVWAQIGTEYAREVLNDKQQTPAVAEQSEGSEDGWSVSWWRAWVSAVVAIVAVVFMLICVRSVAAKAIMAVGRNPRARTTIFGLALLSVVAVVIVGLAMLFVAVGILVLPLM